MLETIAGFHDARSLEEGLTVVGDGIRRRFGAARVVIGLVEDGATRVATISQQAVVDPRAPETRLLAEAMEEAWRGGRQVFRAATTLADATAGGAEAERETAEAIAAYREATGEPLEAGAAHRALLAGRPTAGVVTTPLCHDGRVIGALLLERVAAASLRPAALELLGQIAAALAPLIDARRSAERSLRAHARDRARETLAALAAPERLLAKGAAAAFALGLVAALLVPIEQRIAAVAELAPLELRVVAAPASGYLARVGVAAGDRVRRGALLFELDTSDLALERDRYAAEIAALGAELRAARASGDRKRAAVLRAQAERARAELSLAEGRIARSTVVAPEDAVVLSGELERLVGAPVERGQRLVELAPPDGYTVGLLVDERDIALVESGQRGTLRLEARPGEPLAFELVAIEPLAVAGDGRNRFRAEATLLAPPANLLPGQTGVGKIEVDDAPALAQLTRRFVDWARLRWWERLG